METQPPSGMVAALNSRRHGDKLQGIPKPGGTAGKVELWVEEKTRRKETTGVSLEGLMLKLKLQYIGHLM